MSEASYVQHRVPNPIIFGTPHKRDMKMKSSRALFSLILFSVSVFLLCITAPAMAQTGTVEAESVPSETNPASGVQITVDITIDMSGVDSPDHLLGSFTASLVWDPGVLCYVSHSGVQAGFTGVVNDADADSGRIAFNGANSGGAGGALTVLTVTFDVCGLDSTGTDLDLEFSAMAAALTFQNLLPILTVSDGHIHITSPVPEGVTAFSIPSDPEPAYCETIEVNITINMDGMSSPDDKLGSFTADLTWDPYVLCYLGNSGLLAGFSGAINDLSTSAGQLLFNGANATGAGGTSTVFSIYFHACGMESTSTDLDLEFSAMAAAYTFSDLLPSLTVTDGSVHISEGGQPPPGDINGDGTNTPGDALCAFWRAILAAWQPECDYPWAELVADVDGNSLITPNDALCIFWKAITGEWPPDCLPPTGKAVVGEGRYDLRIGSCTGKEGDIIAVPVAVNRPDGFDAFGLHMVYPADLLTFQGISVTEATEDWIALEGVDIGPGVLSIGGFHIEGLSAKGEIPILEAVFAVKEGARGEGVFDVAHLMDNLAGAHVERGRFTVTVLPTEYGLTQNYPNPFNPETEIAFSLPEGAQVTLTVYNVLGQVMEILVDGQMDAGHHTVYWNGTNVASGIYFYRMHANDYSDTKRMVLMK